MVDREVVVEIRDELAGVRAALQLLHGDVRDVVTLLGVLASPPQSGAELMAVCNKAWELEQLERAGAHRSTWVPAPAIVADERA